MTTAYQDAVDQLSKLYQFSGITLHVALFDDQKLEVPRIFTADPSTDLLSATNTFADTVRLRLTTTGTLPAPLQPNTDYWVVNASSANWKLALVPGGTAIDITSAGSGTHTATEQAMSRYSSLAALVRSEANYQGSGRQALSFSGRVTKLDYAANKAFYDPLAYTFSPTAGNISYKWIGLIVGGVATAGNNTGRIRDFYDVGSRQTIMAGTSFTQTITPTINLT